MIRFSLAASALALLLPVGSAMALPIHGTLPSGPPIENVQMSCDYNRCVDPRTGVYTQSHCDRRGCYPIGGAVGRLGGRAPAYQDEYEEPPRPRYRQQGRGGFDCNPSRCVEMSTGAVWESTCDYSGCRPLRPARGYRNRY